MPSIVSLDIETTGLSSLSDVILEIGAVRFNGHRVEEEFSTLINPGRHIPPFITQLTGITDEMVRNAPLIEDVVAEFSSFVGNSAVLGHNVGFDLSFLQRYDILRDNDIIDTYELASVLLPAASRYNLGALAMQLGIYYQESHRALEDARTSFKLFNALYEKASELPIDLIAEFVRLGEPFDWGANHAFRQILKNMIKKPGNVIRGKTLDTHNLFTPPSGLFNPPLEPNEVLIPLNPDEVAALLEYGGPFSKYFNQYEHRPQQVEMLRSVANSLTNGMHLMVEAGTGTGKSFAYLVPAALWAFQNNMRVVISTNTINLQDQLIQKDIPDLAKALGMDLRATVLKGRGNYLCPRRLENIRHHGPESSEEMRVLAKIMVWLFSGGSGDRNEINLNGPIERDAWYRLSAEDEGCKSESCVSRMGGTCPFFQAHQSSESSHIVVVNHALLLADMATGSRILPDYQYLIVDEAHHLESATTNALSYKLTQGDVTRLIKELGSTSSATLGKLLSLMKEFLPPSDFALGHQTITRLTDLAFRLNHDFIQFFKTIDLFLVDCRNGAPVTVYGQQERIIPSTRTLQKWENVEIAWSTTEETLTLLTNLLTSLIKTIGEIKLSEMEELEDIQGDLSNQLRRFEEIATNLNGMVSKPDAQYVYWLEISGNRNELALQIAPLHIGSLMEKYLWHEKSCVILTSATLTAHDSFDYMRNRLNADEADELSLGSPFDYESSALLYLVNDIPEPADRLNYQKSVEKILTRLSKASNGRLLALFTSYAQLKQTSTAISPILSEAGISIYEQGEGASANTLLENFRSAEKAVLLGTRSFWEGVDIPGEALSVLVIIKLPFDVPTDPIVAARSETFDNPFAEYNLPEAILRFRQGFGRLIRTQFDRGVVAILDRRILSKQYGKLFVESLPHCTVKVDNMQKLPEVAAKWLN